MESEEFMEPKGGRLWDGTSPPPFLKTFVLFFRFFHLALRFWNQTWSQTRTESHSQSPAKEGEDRDTRYKIPHFAVGYERADFA